MVPACKVPFSDPRPSAPQRAPNSQDSANHVSTQKSEDVSPTVNEPEPEPEPQPLQDQEAGEDGCERECLTRNQMRAVGWEQIRRDCQAECRAGDSRP